MTKKDEKFFYTLGIRDTMATVLTQNYKELKLPKLAKEYKEKFGKHFTLDWHLIK